MAKQAPAYTLHRGAPCRMH